MTPTEEANLINRLKAEIEKTQGVIADYEEMSKPVSPDVSIGRISRMDAINNKSITEAALRQAQLKLKMLKEVLSKAGTAQFGKCVRCGLPIPAGRIMFKPESTHCVKCAK